MDIDKALLIMDPVTRDEALAAYGDDCTLRAAAVEEAGRVLVKGYRKAMEDIRTAAIGDVTPCELCTGGMSGSGICPHEDMENMPKCVECGGCQCAGCVDTSGWTYCGPDRVRGAEGLEVDQ